MEWDDLRTVLAVGRAGTLSGAARALNVNHSTVFRRVGLIEEGLGVRLFERHRDGYTPTPAGEEVCALAGRMDGDVVALERRLAGRDLRPAGLVRVTTTDTIMAQLLPPILAAFRAAHPEITLEVAAANRFFNLTKRDADVAIRPTSTPPEALVGRRICAVATAVYGAASLGVDGRRERDLMDLPWVGPDDSLGDLKSARWLAAMTPAPTVVCRANSVLGMFAAAKAGLGAAALPCFLADPEPMLRRLQAPLPALATELWLLTHRDLRRVARIRAFLDFVALALSAQRAALAGSGQGRRQRVPPRA